MQVFARYLVSYAQDESVTLLEKVIGLDLAMAELSEGMLKKKWGFSEVGEDAEKVASFKKTFVQLKLFKLALASLLMRECAILEQKNHLKS